MRLRYTFSIQPPAALSARAPDSGLVRHARDEFRIDLPSHWKSSATTNSDVVHFHSDTERASIILDLQRFGVPCPRGRDMAELNLDRQIEVYRQQYPGRLEVLRRLIWLRSGSSDIEMTYAAEVEGEHLFLYFGYMTSRKLLGLLLICRPDRGAASRLFTETLGRFRARCP